MLGPVPPSTGNPFSSAYTTLSADIDATQNTIPLTSVASFPPTGGVIKIGTEEIIYTDIVGSNLIGAVRGHNGTTPATHSTLDPVACSTIIVTDVNHGAVENDFVTFSGATAFDAFTVDNLNKEHQVFHYISDLNSLNFLFFVCSLGFVIVQFSLFCVLEPALPQRN